MAQWLYVSSECLHPIDSPPPPPRIVADDLPVLADLHLGHQNGVGIHILA